MKPEHAAHLQNMADLDGGHDDDYCRRESCWDRQAGVIACWTMEAGGKDGRCRSCDHLPECHSPTGKADRKRFFDEMMAEMEANAANARARKNLEAKE